MKRIVKTSKEIFSDDLFLPLEHALDKAYQEALKVSQIQRSKKIWVAADTTFNMANDLDSMKKKVRNLRSFLLKDYDSSQTYETMKEDNSQYLED